MKSLLFVLFVGVLSGCFDPEIQPSLRCGPEGECPGGQVCERTLSICVPASTPIVAGVRFVTQPTAVEALVVSPAVRVEIVDSAGQKVRESGARMAIEVQQPNASAVPVGLMGTRVVDIVDGVATFEDTRFDRPGTSLRLQARVGEWAAVSERFDVSVTRPSLELVATDAPIEGCGDISYSLSQAQGLPVDLLVEFDPDGPGGPAPFRRATQGPSGAGFEGVQGIPGAPQPRSAVFTWNSSSDLSEQDTDAHLRITPSVRGVLGHAVERGPYHVRNGWRWDATSAPHPGIKVVDAVDLDADGWLDLIAASAQNVEIRFGGAEQKTLSFDTEFVVTDLVTGDFDSNGFADVAIATEGGGIRLLLQGREPRRSFVAGDVTTGSTYVAQILADDFDRDGSPDLAVVDEADGSVSVYRQTRGAGAGFVLMGRPWTGGFTGRVAVAHATPAGNLRLVVGRKGSRPAAIIRVEHGAFAAPELDQLLFGDQVAAGDLDGDGREEVVALADDGLRVRSERFGTTAEPITGVSGVLLAVRDLNKDGKAEILVQKEGLLEAVALTGFFPYLDAQTPVVVKGGLGEVSVGLSFGDINRDGRDDIVVADVAADLLWTLDNESPRRCDVRLTGPIGNRELMGSFTTADVNGDGKLDVLGNGLVLDGLGNGEFSATLLDDAAGASVDASQQAADLDSDGAVDVVALRQSTAGDAGTLHVYFNNPDRRGELHETLIASTGATAFTIGDVDGDGAMDLVVLSTNGLEVRRGQPRHPREFMAPNTTWLDQPCNSCSLRLVDLNQDGLLDVVLIGDDSLRTLLGDRAGPGHFLLAATLHLNSPVLIGSGDIVGDERPEILVSEVTELSTLTRTLVAYDVDLPPLAVHQVWWSPGSYASGVVGDLDGDGMNELVASLGRITLIVTPRTVPEGSTLPLDRVLLSGASMLSLADVNGDGRLDLLMANSGVYGFYVALGSDGLQPFEGPQYIGEFGKGGPVAFGNISGDGFDILGASNTEARLLRCDYSACRSSSVPILASARSLILRDFDGNGLDDIVADSDVGTQLLLSGRQPSTVPGEIDAVSFVPVCVTSGRSKAVGDINRDGRADLVVLDAGQLEWVSDVTSGCSERRPIFSVGSDASFTDPGFVKVVDMNGDGLGDIVAAQDAVWVALQSSSTPGTFLPASRLTRSYGPIGAVVVEDVDHDGMPDVLIAVHEYAYLLRNAWRTAGQFAPEVELDSYAATDRLAASDLDGDGWPDIVTGSDEELDVLLQDASTGLFRYAYSVSGQGASSGKGSGYLLDIGNDGRMEYLESYSNVGLFIREMR